MSSPANKNLATLGFVVIILIVGLIYLAMTNPSPNRAPANTSAPVNTPVPFEWTRVPYDYASANTEIDIDLRACPELRCDVIANVQAGRFIRIENLVIGASVDGNRDWFEINHNGTLLYVPVVYVFSETVTRMAMTESPRGRFVTPRPSNTPRVAPTLAPTSDEFVENVTDFSATMYANSNAIIRACASTTCQNLGRVDAGSAVVVTGIVDGEIVETGYAIWYRVEHGGVIGYVYQRLLVSDAPAIVATSEPVNGNAVSVPTAMVCPRNCDEARALGWTDVMAGQCSNLDRDGDGVACYGD